MKTGQEKELLRRVLERWKRKSSLVSGIRSEYRLGARKTLAIAQKEQIDLAILQSRSPSCGVKEIYDGTFSGTLIEGDGVTAKRLKESGVAVETRD